MTVRAEVEQMEADGRVEPDAAAIRAAEAADPMRKRKNGWPEGQPHIREQCGRGC